jgi:predicted MFS family arabinose efflux permease
VSPVVGRLADRYGPLRPIRGGLAAATVVMFLLPFPGLALVCAMLMVLATAAFGLFWAPSMSLLSESAEAVGAHQGLAFGLVNLAWAIGMVCGAAGGGAIAKAASDAIPYILLAAVCAATLAALSRARARAAVAAR